MVTTIEREANTRSGRQACLALAGVREQDVPLARIRHSDRQCYRREGHGGQGIETWPIYHFFRLYTSGEQERASDAFAAWYLVQFMKYRDVPKHLGGMRGGSLARTWAAMGMSDSGADDEEVRNRTLKDAIELRVRQRLALIESIRRNGYRPGYRDPVLGIRRTGAIYLEGGHHRGAALKALGWETLPSVMVFQGWSHYSLWCRCRALYNSLMQKQRWFSGTTT